MNRDREGQIPDGPSTKHLGLIPDGPSAKVDKQAERKRRAAAAHALVHPLAKTKTKTKRRSHTARMHVLPGP